LLDYSRNVFDGVSIPSLGKKSNLILLKGPEEPKHNPRSYRSLCLLDIIGKIFEKILINRLPTLRPGLEEDHLQFGFRKKRSTQDAVNKFCDDVRRTDEKYALVIFIDIKGDFDNLWWPTLFVNMQDL